MKSKIAILTFTNVCLTLFCVGKVNPANVDFTSKKSSNNNIILEQEIASTFTMNVILLHNKLPLQHSGTEAPKRGKPIRGHGN